MILVFLNLSLVFHILFAFFPDVEFINILVPTPTPDKEDKKSKDKEGGNNQKLILFIRGNAIS